MKTAFNQLFFAIGACCVCLCFLRCSKKHDNPEPTTINNTIVSTFAGNTTSGWAVGTGTEAFFEYLIGIVFSQVSGNLFVCDGGLKQIREITLGASVSVFAGQLVDSTFISPYTRPYTGDGTGLSAGFINPRSFTIDGAGNMYVLDGYPRFLRKITPEGVVTTILITIVNNNIDYSKWVIQNITADAAGNIYADAFLGDPTLAKSTLEQIYKISPDGSARFIAGSTIGFANGNGSAAFFNGVTAMVADALGNLFVADYNNREIRKITPNGDVTTFAGNVNAPYTGGAEYTDGMGAAASFNGPHGITMDKAGNFFIIDLVEERIRKITSQGLVSTVAGTGATGLTNGLGNQATFNNPTAIAADGSGNLYVLDSGLIRKITFH